jgi:hypothetical protein
LRISRFFDVVDAVVDAVDGVDGVDGVIKYHTTYFHEKLKTRNFLKSFLFLEISRRPARIPQNN